MVLGSYRYRSWDTHLLVLGDLSHSPLSFPSFNTGLGPSLSSQDLYQLSVCPQHRSPTPLLSRILLSFSPTAVFHPFGVEGEEEGEGVWPWVSEEWGR